ncbi:MAG TPA: 6-phosphogluconolactonase [Acidobacteriota bacterium]|nr:6-phosphogluconolactonase [Acidobacteriota bacterium]
MIVTGSRVELEEKAAAATAETINTILARQPHAVLALCGGTSVEGIFGRLAGMTVDWKRLHLFMVDERLVPIDSEQANYRLVKQYFSAVVPCENLHPFIVDPGRPDKGAGGYAAELMRYGGVFDVVLVSSGEDGHIGALYPDHHSIDDLSGRFIIMNDSPKPPPGRMSSSAGLLRQARAGIMLFFGENKKNALDRFLDGNSTIRQVPAKIIASLPKYFVFTDQEISEQ